MIPAKGNIGDGALLPRPAALGPMACSILPGMTDREMYVLGAPHRGPKLVHIATIAIDVAPGLCSTSPWIGGMVFGISRPTAKYAHCLPEVQLPDGVLRLT